MTAKTATQRSRSLRAQRAAQGLHEVRGIYAAKAQHKAIKAAAKAVKLNKETK